MKVFPYLRLAFLSNQTTFSIKVVIWFIRSVRSKVVVLTFILVTKRRKSNSKFIPPAGSYSTGKLFFGAWRRNCTYLCFRIGAWWWWWWWQSGGRWQRVLRRERDWPTASFVLDPQLRRKIVKKIQSVRWLALRENDGVGGLECV